MSSTQVSTLISDIRYDLRDYGEQSYDDTYLVNMLNRGVKILERELIAFNSDLTKKSTTATLSTSENSVELDNTIDSIIRVYIDQTELYHITLEELYRRRIDVIGSSTGQPYYYATWIKPSGSDGRAIGFDYTADQDYTISYIYNELTSTLTTSSYMPYDDMFNDYLREGVVLFAQSTKDKNIVPVDKLWRDMFRGFLFQTSLASGRMPRYRKKDF